jgi:hypothetical protein
MLGRLGQDIKAQRAQKMTDCVGLIPAKQFAPRLCHQFTEASNRFQSLVQLIRVVTDFLRSLACLLLAFGGRLGGEAQQPENNFREDKLGQCAHWKLLFLS